MMAIFTRVVALAFAGLAVLPWAAAHTIRTPTADSKSCSSNEFWYETKSCCLPHGGVPNPPSPPKGQDCPPSNYYWGEKQGCCVPKYPTPPNNPPPQCKSGWEWESATQCCKPSQPSKPSSPPSHPSGGYGYGSGSGSGKGWKRETTHSFDTSLCPSGLDTCPIPGTGGYECLDTSSELESCGGCTAVGQGEDCTAIANSWNVGCERGKCAVYSCVGGFKPSANGTSCILA